MIAVYLVRHAAAADSEGPRGGDAPPRSALPDDDRPLTSKGRRKFRKVARQSVRSHRTDPVNRLPHERKSEIDPPCYLRGEFFESFGAERASRPLRGRRQ